MKARDVRRAEDAENDTRNPDHRHTQRISDNRQAKAVGPARGQPVHEDVREHADRQRDQGIGQELQRGYPLAAHQQFGTTLGNACQRLVQAS